MDEEGVGSLRETGKIENRKRDFFSAEISGGNEKKS